VEPQIDYIAVVAAAMLVMMMIGNICSHIYVTSRLV
jgi:hypothetical protein